MVARLTLDQKVACSNHVGVNKTCDYFSTVCLVLEDVTSQNGRELVYRSVNSVRGSLMILQEGKFIKWA